MHARRSLLGSRQRHSHILQDFVMSLSMHQAFKLPYW